MRQRYCDLTEADELKSDILSQNFALRLFADIWWRRPSVYGRVDQHLSGSKIDDNPSATRFRANGRSQPIYLATCSGGGGLDREPAPSGDTGGKEKEPWFRNS